MTHVELLDATLRDGQQSLWGMRMQAGMALPVADVLDRTGFSVIDFAGSSFMEVLVKYCREDPWAGLDLLRGAIHRTPMRGGMRGNACVSFGVTPAGADGPVDAPAQRARRPLVLDLRRASTGSTTSPGSRGSPRSTAPRSSARVFFSHSPVHTDEYLAGKARRDRRGAGDRRRPLLRHRRGARRSSGCARCCRRSSPRRRASRSSSTPTT